jgi:hypothetical protein
MFDGSHPDVSRSYQNKAVSVKHNLIYSLITITLATCFDPVGSSLGLHYEPTVDDVLPSQAIIKQRDLDANCTFCINTITV